MKSVLQTPAFVVLLSTSACNARIDIGVPAGSRVIDGSGLAPPGEVGTLTCLTTMAMALLLMLTPRQVTIESSLGDRIPY